MMRRASGSAGLAAATLACLFVAACGSAPNKAPAPSSVAVESGHHVGAARRADAGARRSPYAPAQEDPSKRGNYTRGGLYAPGIADSAPHGGIPDVDLIPEPEVRDEPHSRYGNRSPYSVLGKQYRVLDSAEGYDETGLASYYGNKFHGRRTSNLEVYDMYAFTAAHKTLPLPSYARVTNLSNGRSVVVRVNDRGPFHEGRIIDLSYAAAVKLGVDRAGTARVEVKGLSPGEDAHQHYDAVAAAQPLAPPAPTPAQATAIDRLVAVLPMADANAGEQPPLAEGPGGPSPSLPVPMAPPAPTPTTTTTTTTAPIVPASAPGALLFQVATFAERANADRALAMLESAGIGGARLADGESGGRRVWRLRVGPVDPAASEELGARLRSLGFEQPQRVHE